MVDDNADRLTGSWENPPSESVDDAKNEATRLENRTEIDTSTPFDSVKEAVSLFGGKGAWTPSKKISNTTYDSVDAELTEVEEETLSVEKDLIAKERETLDVLKELDKTKRIVEELKLKLQKVASENSPALTSNTGSCCRRREILPVRAMFGAFVDAKEPTYTSVAQVIFLPRSPETLLHIKNCEMEMESMNSFVASNAIERDYVHVSDSSTPEHEHITPETNSEPVLLARTQVNIPVIGTVASLPQTCTDTNPAPEEALTQLKETKVNLGGATLNFSEIWASIRSLYAELFAEKLSLVETRERLNSKYRSIASMEEKLSVTLGKLNSIKNVETGTKAFDGKLDSPNVFQELHLEYESYQKMAETSKSDPLRTLPEIEHTNTSIKTVEIMSNAAKKMAEKEVLENGQNVETRFSKIPQHSEVELSHEEYNVSASKGKEAEAEAEHDAKTRIEAAMLKVDEANASKLEVLRELQRAADDVKVCKEALRKALLKAENANYAKLAAEESLRRWRCEHGKQRRSVQSSVKFKNSYSLHISQNIQNSVILDVNGVNLIGDKSNRMSNPTPSIGQILSRKLTSADNFGIEFECDEPKVSLAQMLRRRNGILSPREFREEPMRQICRERN